MPVAPDPRTDGNRLQAPLLASRSRTGASGKPKKAPTDSALLLPLSPIRSPSDKEKKPIRDMPQPSAVLMASRSPPMSPSAQSNDITPLETFALRVFRHQLHRGIPSKPSQSKEDLNVLVSLPKRKRTITTIPKIKATISSNNNSSLDQSSRRRRKRHLSKQRDQDDAAGHLNAGVYVLENSSTGHKYFGTTWDLKNAAAQCFSDLRDGLHPHQGLVESYATDTNAVIFRILECVAPPPTPTDRQPPRRQSDSEFAVHTLEFLLQQRLAFHTRRLFRKSALRLVRRRLIRPWLAAYWPTWKQKTLDVPVAFEQLAAAVVIQSFARMCISRGRGRRQRRQRAALRIARFFALCAFKRVFIKRRRRQLRHAAARRIQQSVLAFLARRRREKRQLAVKKWLCARRIQRIYRGHVARGHVHRIRLERQRFQAAIHLQRLARGFLTRRQLQRQSRRQYLDACCTKIQRVWRGRYTRTVVLPSLQLSQRRLAAARTLQRFYRRVVVHHNLSVAATQLKIQRHHATRIHAAYKNYLAHKFGWAAMAYQTEHASAVKVQRAMRRWFYFSRIRRLAIANTQYQAALRIQRVTRGCQARHQVQELRRFKRATTAVSKIQRVWRLCCGFSKLRLAVTAWKRDRSARKIQAAVRGHRARRVYLVFRDQARRERAATKLQTIFRASRARREWRRRVELQRSGLACLECGEREASVFLGRADLQLCPACLSGWGASQTDDDVVPLALYRRQQQVAMWTQRVFRRFQRRMVGRFGACSLCERLAIRIACRSCASVARGATASFYCHSCDALLHKNQSGHRHDRLRVERFHRQSAAAITIQKHARRFLQHHTIEQLQSRRQSLAAAKIQTVVRGRQQRRRTRALVDARRQQELRQYEAVVKIQRSVRKWLVRRTVGERIRRRASATVIQRMVRGREGRKQAYMRRRRRDAAVCIQRCVRGARGRRIAAERRRRLMERRRTAATATIQRSLRRWIVGRRRRTAAAIVIQCAWRCCSARMALTGLRKAREERLRLEAETREEERRRIEEQRRHAAATKIQNTVRRRQARKRLGLLRVARAALLRGEQLAIWLAAERRGAERIQRFVRRRWLDKAAAASAKIQRTARGHLARAELKRRRVRRRAAVRIQRAFRYSRVKRKLTRLVSLESFVAERAEGTGGWVELLDEESGCVYYYHRETMASSWVKPADWMGEDAATAALRGEGGGGEQPEELQMPEWVEYWDENVGAAYYYNTVTGEATWATPEGGVSSATASNQSEGSGGDGHYVWPPGAPVDKAALGKAEEGTSVSNQVEQEGGAPPLYYYDDQGNAYTYYEGYGYVPYNYTPEGGAVAGGEGFDQSPIDTSYNLHYEIYLTQQQRGEGGGASDPQEQDGGGGGGGGDPFN